MLIFLIGPSGSGKTYWAGKLASLFRFGSIDTDAVITGYFQQPVSAIFREKGEIFFRKAESDVLQSIIREYKDAGNLLVATGGGAPCHAGNMDLMLENGVVIYLEATAALLAERLSDAADRPLLAGRRRGELLSLLQQQLENRSPVYNRAHYKVDAASATSATFAAIIESVQNLK